METARTASGEELLRHQGFVRRLAHELVRDAARADDLVQETWVQALRHPPRADSARGWFRTVLRNLASRSAREAWRRAEREAAVARPEVQPSASEIGERLAQEQRLVQAVEALREPYRTAIFLRYFEDLAPGDIAARERLPVATIKTRLRRGLEMLREALDREQGRRAWALALVPLARPGQAAIPVAVPLLAGGLALAGATAWLLRQAPPAPETSSGIATLARSSSTTHAPPGGVELIAPSAPAGAPRVLPARAEGPEREPVQATAAEPPSRDQGAEPAEAEPLRLRGRVLFPDGSGAQDASVAFGPFLARCGRGGWFEMPLDEDDARPSVRRGSLLRVGSEIRVLRRGRSFQNDDALVAWHDGWVPVVRSDYGTLVEEALAAAQAELAPVELVLTTLALEIRGILLDRTGVPAAGWRYSLLDGVLVARGDYRPFSAEDLASGADSHQATGVDGTFAFRGLVPEKSYRVRAWNERTLEQVVSEPIPAGTEGVVLRARQDPWRPVVDGVIVGLDGYPLADVRCRLSMNEYEVDSGAWMTSAQDVRTDGHGRFVFVDVPHEEIFIRYNGYGSSGELALPPGEPGRDLRIELVRCGELLFESSSVARRPDELRVLDEAGERLALEVWHGEGRSSSSLDLAVAPGGACRATVSELARWLVLRREGQELTRLPLSIRHGETARIHW
jgi:RNA polymerase sigma-70 factor (ECF subfamily)